MRPRAPRVRLPSRPVANDPGDLYLATVVLNVQDMRRAVDFWTAALGYRMREDDLDEQFTMLVHPEGRHAPLSLQHTDHPPREPVRVHVDLYTSEQERHVERLVGLGATRVTDWPYPADADGNEFCVIDHVEP